MLTCYMFMASLMAVPLVLLKNTTDSFLCAEFWIVECFPRSSILCMNVVHFPVLMFHLNEHANNTWTKRKTFLKWYSVTLLLACEDFLHILVFHEHVYGEHCMTACTHLTHRVCKIYTQGTVPCIQNFVTGYILIAHCQLLPLILFTDEAIFTCNGIKFSPSFLYQCVVRYDQ
jgi:hypothetical protein